MAHLPEFELQRPDNLAQALALLAEPGARLMAGGTDLVPNLRRGLLQPSRLVDLRALPDIDVLQRSDAELVMGAGVTLRQLTLDPELARDFPAIAEAAASIAGPGHRTAATVGGNLCLDTRCAYYNQSEWWRAANGYCLKRGGTTCHVAPQGGRCHAAFSGDLAPALLALDAHVDLASVRGTRRLPLADLYRDDGAAHLTLDADELLLSVILPLPPKGARNGYRKARVRGAMDFPLAGIGCALTVDGTRLRALRIAVTGTNSNPFVLDGTDALLGRTPDDGWYAELGKLVQKQVSPMRSTVTPAHYRRQVAAALAQRLVRELLGAD